MRFWTYFAAVVVSTLVMPTAYVSAEQDDAWVVRGQVVDVDANPVDGADVAWCWSANGVPRDSDGKPWPTPKDRDAYRQRLVGDGWKELARHVGTMEPVRYWDHAKTNTDGYFSLRIDRYSKWAIIAMDRDRCRGALEFVDQTEGDLKKPLVMRDLTHVHGQLSYFGSAESPVQTSVRVFVEPDPVTRPLDRYELLSCSSLDADFSFKLPPGTYQLLLCGYSPDAEVKSPPTLLLRGDQRDVDLATLVLEPKTLSLQSRIEKWQAKGDRGDYTKHFAREPPAWFIADARGVKKDVQLPDYRGKWVVLEFWNLSCTVCLKRSLPEWSAFYTAHADQRNQFEILSICLDVDEDLSSIADVERRLQPIVKHVWHGQDLPFPMLLDAGLRTWQSFGLDYMARTLLVDPDGNLTDVIGHDEVRDHLLKQFDAAK